MRRHPLMLIALLLAACFPDAPAGQGGAEAEDTLPSPPFSLETLPPESLIATPRVGPLPARPETRTDTVHIEGMPQVERMTLVRSPEGFQPPFTTYVPPGLRTEFMPGDSTPSVRFVAAFGGRVNPDAYLQVRMYPPGSSELVARNAVDAYLRGRNPREDNVRKSERWPWAREAYDFISGGERGTELFVGTMAIARHDNRFLHVLVHYPAEYGDGMGPRVEKILREWRWEDDGSWLSATP